MIWSLNEIESLARKAARGAGMPWGIAEEAGKAARWLCAAGLPGAEALATLLRRNDDRAPDTRGPADVEAAVWQAAHGPLCPLMTGAALCDHADRLAQGRTIRLAEVSFPLLLLPYMAIAADDLRLTLCLSFDRVAIARGPGGTLLRGDPEDVNPELGTGLAVAQAEVPHGRRLRRAYRATVSPDAAGILQGFARRTYAPDTAASRLAGAGAGLTDND